MAGLATCTTFVRRLLFRLTFATALWPLWLLRVVVDDRPIYWAFNSLTVYLVEVFGLAFVVVALLESRMLKRRWRWGDRPLAAILAGLALLGTLSALWAVQPRLALWTAAGWWLVFGVYLSVANGGEDWRALTPLALVLLSAEVAVATLQVKTGSTLIAGALLKWDTDLRVGNMGASYLLNTTGQPLLRAYGTTEHPNHLAGLAGILALTILGAWLIQYQDGPGRWLWGGGLVVSIWLLGLTFSRGGWIAFATCATYVLLCSWHRPDRVALSLALMGMTVFILSALFGQWIVQRIVPSTEAWVEIKSLQDRALMAGGAWELFWTRPLLGVGAGNYMQGMVALPSSQIQVPVHSAIALAATELGLAGAALAVSLYGRMIQAAWRARRSIVAAVGVALPLGLLLANAFDLYGWSLGPGRLLLGLVCGLCASTLATSDLRAIDAGQASS